MAELDNKIKDILSSPDKINQILSAITGLSNEEDKSPEQEDTPSLAEDASAVPAVATSAPNSVSNLTALSKIDPKIMNTAMRLLNEYSYDDDKIVLLNALKPHLKSERRQRIDKASQILRISKSVKSALHSLSGGDTLV